jgi:hypothetical protein
MDYLELPFNKKLALLREHSFGCEWPNLEEEQWCLHCRKKFRGHAARVWADGKGRLWLECGTPGCDGSPIDWAPFPWWDPTYSAPKKSRKNPGTRGRHTRGTRSPKRRKKDKGNDDDVPF